MPIRSPMSSTRKHVLFVDDEPAVSIVETVAPRDNPRVIANGPRELVAVVHVADALAERACFGANDR